MESDAADATDFAAADTIVLPRLPALVEAWRALGRATDQCYGPPLPIGGRDHALVEQYNSARSDYTSRLGAFQYLLERLHPEADAHFRETTYRWVLGNREDDDGGAEIYIATGKDVGTVVGGCGRGSSADAEPLLSLRYYIGLYDRSDFEHLASDGGRLGSLRVTIPVRTDALPFTLDFSRAAYYVVEAPGLAHWDAGLLSSLVETNN